MATIQEIKESASSIASSIQDIDVALDEVRAKVEELRQHADSEEGVTQAQLDELADILNGAKEAAQSVKEEASSIVEPPPEAPAPEGVEPGSVVDETFKPVEEITDISGPDAEEKAPVE